MLRTRSSIVFVALAQLATGALLQACVPVPMPPAPTTAVPTAPTEANKALVRRYYDEALTAGKLEVLDELLAPNYKRYLTATTAPLDEAAQKKRLAGMRTIFPDLKITIENMIAEGDLVTVLMTIRGTQKAAYQGIPPTDKPVTVTAVEVVRIENGRFVEHWGGADNLDLLKQLGGVVTAAPPK